jgi:predicted RNA binding protein YcfA (HicA-like mRNA interferase family)
MSPKLPVLKGRQVLRALRKAGFLLDHVQGSHHIMVHSDDPTRMVSVPVHAGKDIKAGTLRALIRAAGLTVAEFQKLL